MSNDLPRPNKIKAIPTLILIALMPITFPAYLIGYLLALVYIAAFCGFKSCESYFMGGLGYETNEQMIRRLLKAMES